MSEERTFVGYLTESSERNLELHITERIRSGKKPNVHVVAVRPDWLGLRSTEALLASEVTQLVTIDVNVVGLAVVRMGQFVLLEIEVHLSGGRGHFRSTGRCTAKRSYFVSCRHGNIPHAVNGHILSDRVVGQLGRDFPVVDDTADATLVESAVVWWLRFLHCNKVAPISCTPELEGTLTLHSIERVDRSEALIFDAIVGDEAHKKISIPGSDLPWKIRSTQFG